jgi:subtilase family serine protease
MTTTLTKGTEIYTTGDMCNASGFGTIDDVVTESWGTYYKVKMDDGREFNLESYQFSDKYLGHCGTRFVTRQAYNDYKSA